MAGIRHHYSILPPVIKILLISNGIIYLLELLFTNFLLGHFALWPLAADSVFGQITPRHEFMPWQLLSYGFLHGSVTHLLLNMYALWLFGSSLENRWGSKNFTLYYLVCVAGAALTQLLVQNMLGQYSPTIGASGGVFGVLLAYGLFFPNQILILLIPPMPIKAKWFVIIYGVIELVFGVTGTDAGVAHFAHLGGMLFGFLLILYWANNRPVMG
ncbi:MAG TPA: rhomboid family intramembrane serine protease [Gammaproteobacteria bacterium]|nr:rhomboid family intramembrane serine protease [Gammaproteobacteria bacterium]